MQLLIVAYLHKRFSSWLKVTIGLKLQANKQDLVFKFMPGAKMLIQYGRHANIVHFCKNFLIHIMKCIYDKNCLETASLQHCAWRKILAMEEMSP
jgi:hypothetical protein